MKEIKKTQEQFEKEVHDLVGDEYTILGKYINMSTKVLVKHNICGNEWFITPSKFLAGRRCSKCFGTHKRTTKEFKEIVFSLVKDEYTVLSNYTNTNKHILMKHNKCGQTWNITPSNFLNGYRCPVCSSHKIVKGINDMWTTNPELAKLLNNADDGYKYTQYSSKRVDWKCQECGEIIKNKRISDICRQGLSCPKCSDGISYPEKFMYNLLKQLDIGFEYQKKFDWCNYELNGKKKYCIYDFYIPSKKLIIEMDGHFHTINAKYTRFSEKEIKQIDKIKTELPRNYKISIIRILCDYTMFENRLNYIKNNIMNSELSTIFNFDNINWKNIDSESQMSFIKKICNLWRNDDKTITELSIYFKIHPSTIRGYLKIGNLLNLCIYNPEEEKRKRYNKSKKSVAVYKNNQYINTFDSIVNLYKLSKMYFGIVLYPKGITDVCNNKQKDYHGFIFRFAKK